MDLERTVKELKSRLTTSKILEKESMKKHTSFKVGGIADIYVKAQSLEDIQQVVKYAKTNDIVLSVIGNGSNILVTDKGIRGIVLEICLNDEDFKPEDDGMIVTVGAGVKLGYLSIKCQSQSLERI